MSSWLPDLSAAGGPRYLAIVDAIAADIRAGRLSPGTRLPPQRHLAWRLKMTVGTVARAYAEAERLGLVSGEVGRGTYVRDPGAEPTVGEYLSVHHLGGNILDMAVNRPSGDNNAAEVAAAVRAATTRPDFPATLSYHLENSFGRYGASGAAWLGRYGLEVPAERVLITVSGQQAMLACMAAVTRPDDCLLVEEFTYPGIKSVAALLGRHLLPVRTDEGGLCPDAFERALAERQGKVLYVISAGSNPTTATLSEERRLAIVAAARRHDAIIIEDGIYAFLDPEAPPPIAALAPERTLYMTSMAKSLSPGLRIGYVAAPEGLVARVAGGISASTLMVPAVMAEAATLMIEDGTAAACAERQRAEAVKRRQLATATLGEALCKAPAAFNLWLPLPPPWRAEGFVSEAKRNGVALSPGASFAVGKPRYEAVRVSISAAPEHQALQRGLRILAGMLRTSAETVVPTV